MGAKDALTPGGLVGRAVSLEIRFRRRERHGRPG